MSERRVLCQLADIADPGAKGFAPEVAGTPLPMFVVRRGSEVWAYLDDCPHRRVPLAWSPDRYLDSTAAYILCANHGALFRIDDGLCVQGPCVERELMALGVTVEDGAVVLSNN